MTRSRTIAALLALLALATSVADAVFFSDLFTPAVVYAVPLLASVYFALPTRYVAALAIWILTVQTIAYALEGSGLQILPASYILGLGYMSVLAVVLADKMQHERGLRSQTAEALAEVQRRVAEVEATISAMPDGIIIYAPTGEIVQLNDAATRMFGYQPGDAELPLEKRMQLLGVTTPEGKPFPPEESPPSRALRGETVKGLIAVLNPAGRQAIWTSNSAAPIYDPRGELLGVIGICSDITQVHALQERQADLVRTISHDLRNPLTPVIGQASLLKRSLLKKGMEKEVKSADAILANARRLNSMIEDLVESVRLESGLFTLRTQDTDLCLLVSDLPDQVGTMEDRDRLEVECQEEIPSFPVDRERLVRAILNLITNALKYSEKPAPVRLVLERQDGEAIISVSDQGPGISPKDQARLFERFYRTETGQRSGGMGLGLYIVRQIAEAHGGRVWVESEPGNGCTFRLALPTSPAPASNPESTPSTPSQH